MATTAAGMVVNDVVVRQGNELPFSIAVNPAVPSLRLRFRNLDDSGDAFVTTIKPIRYENNVAIFEYKKVMQAAGERTLWIESDSDEFKIDPPIVTHFAVTPVKNYVNQAIGITSDQAASADAGENVTLCKYLQEYLDKIKADVKKDMLTDEAIALIAEKIISILPKKARLALFNGKAMDIKIIKGFYSKNIQKIITEASSLKGVLDTRNISLAIAKALTKNLVADAYGEGTVSAVWGKYAVDQLFAAYDAAMAATVHPQAGLYDLALSEVSITVDSLMEAKKAYDERNAAETDVMTSFANSIEMINNLRIKYAYETDKDKKSTYNKLANDMLMTMKDGAKELGLPGLCDIFDELLSAKAAQSRMDYTNMNDHINKSIAMAKELDDDDYLNVLSLLHINYKDAEAALRGNIDYSTLKF